MTLMANLPLCLAPDSTIPTNVRFLFHEGDVTKEVKAHKMILALVSDVFTKEFFGSLKEDKDDIDIKDATQEVYQAMIDFIYNKQVELGEYDLPFISQLYNLAEKYNVKDLRREIIASIPKHIMTDENVLDVAILAEENIHHKPLSEELYTAAAGYLMKKFDGKLDNAVEFISITEATQANGLVLMKMITRMKEMTPITTKCQNCKSDPCLDSRGLTRENFVPGAQVVDNAGLFDIQQLLYVNSSKGTFQGRLKDGRVLELVLNPFYFNYKCT